jgi:hypothetical protein
LGGGIAERLERGDGLGRLEILEEADDNVDGDQAGEDAAFDPGLDAQTGAESEQ